MSFRNTFLREAAAAGLPTGPAAGAPVIEAELDALPEPARRFLRFMRVPGRPRDWSFRAGFRGRFRRSANEAWHDCEAWQYNTRLGVARLFHLRMTFAGFLPVVGRDLYIGGHGRMRIRVLDRFTVEDAKGEPFDIGELVTYLNDAILIAPSMLLVPDVLWSARGSDAFEVSLTDAGRTVRASVEVSAAGAPVNFHTTDRFLAAPGVTPIRRPWSTPITGWREDGDRMEFTEGRAVWHEDGAELVYIELRPIPGSRRFNVPPGA